MHDIHAIVESVRPVYCSHDTRPVQLVELDEKDSKLKWSKLATAFGFRVACRTSFE
jgi:hypothetical protein